MGSTRSAYHLCSLRSAERAFFDVAGGWRLVEELRGRLPITGILIERVFRDLAAGGDGELYCAGGAAARVGAPIAFAGAGARSLSSLIPEAAGNP